MKQSSVFIFCILLCCAACSSHWDKYHLVGHYHGEKRWLEAEPGELIPDLKYELDILLLPDSTFNMHQWFYTTSSSYDYWGTWSAKDSLITIHFLGTIINGSGKKTRIPFDDSDFYYREYEWGYLKISDQSELTGRLMSYESVTVVPQ